MEITFSSMRIRRGELKSNFAVDYMLTIKKPNRLPRYVVRNEADFEQFSIAIAKELGKGSKIKPIPPRGVYSDSDDEYEEPSPSQHPKGSSLGSTLSRGFGKSSTTLNKNLNHKSSGALGRKTSFGKSASTLVRRRSNSASVAPNPAPALPLDGKNVKPFRSGATGRSSRLRRFSVKTLEEKEGTSNLNTRDDSDLEGWAGLGATRRGFPISSAPSTPGVDENKEINFDFSDNTAAAGGSNSQRSSMEIQKFGGIAFNFPNFGKSKSSLKLKPSAQSFYTSTSSLALNESSRNCGGSERSSQDSKRPRQPSQSHLIKETENPNLPDLPNKRRRRLRAWLRDTLSVRGAVDSQEARDFLSIGSFQDAELRASDRSSMAAISDYDDRRRVERESDEKSAGEEVLALRAEIEKIWKDCKEGGESDRSRPLIVMKTFAYLDHVFPSRTFKDGFPKMLWAIQRSSSFPSLPVSYQQVASYANLQFARFLHGTFVASDVSRGNLARARDLHSSIPWSTLVLAMKEPTGIMLEMIQDSILKPEFIQNLLAILLEESDSDNLEQQLLDLRNQLDPTMMQKVENFASSDDDLKRIVRDHAEKTGMPLVAAIVRGAEEPRLSE